jgi:hypothetical protein
MWGRRRHHEAGAYPEAHLRLCVLRLLRRRAQVLAQGRLELVHGRDIVRDDLGQRVAWLTAAGKLHRRLRPEGVIVVGRCIAEGLRVRIWVRAHVRSLRVRISSVHGKWGLTRILGAE